MNGKKPDESALSEEQKAALIRGMELISTIAVTPSIVWHEGVEYHLQDGRYVPVGPL